MAPRGSRSGEDLQVRLALPAESKSVGEARNALGGLARRIGAPETDVKIAVSEAVGNAVIHAFRARPPGTIEVRAWHQPGRLLVTVADDGIGMAPNPGNPGLGLGLPLITKVCEDLRLSSSEEGTTVSMRFAAPGAP